MDLLDSIWARLPERTDRPAVIAVDGVVGAGKTTAAHAIRDRFGDGAVVVSTDLYIIVTRAEWDARLARGGIVLHEWYDLAKIRRTLKQIRDGGQFTVEGLYNLSNGEHDYAMDFDCTHTRAVVLEGLFSFHKTFEDLVDVKVFLDAPVEPALERARVRDETVRNIPHKMWLKKLRIYHDCYQPYVPQLRQAADVVHTVEIGP